MADGFSLAYLGPDTPTGTTQILTFRFQAQGAYKGLITVDWLIVDVSPSMQGDVSGVAGVDVVQYVWLDYDDGENVTVTVSNIPSGKHYKLKLMGTSGSYHANAESSEGVGAPP